VAAETLLREVEDKRKKALERLDSEFAAENSEINNRTELEKQRILENGKRQAQDQAQREKIRIIGAAKLQSKKLIFDATEKMLESNLSALRRTLAEWGNSREYQELLPKMAEYASKRLGGEINVICRQSDVQALKKAGVEIASSDLNSIGGFRAEKKDGTLELDLTFEEILRSREEDIRRTILGGD
jgi:V/A-type H+/Na+-transporting ATPase subunit E